MFKQISLLSLLVVGLNADNINMQNTGTITNYGTVNNIQNNDSEKAKFDSKIVKLAQSVGSNPNSDDRDTFIGVLEGAKNANQYNISAKEKSEKCIEHSVGLNFLKINVKLARHECEKIFLN
ncbi:hypothetical protein [Sulfurospirillum diekertiae]|uniref:Uncharacterized protein n=1 Tax=Sulfurospirillum diekertiae TaxID=1854492 RepID=A0A1Y0HPJ5_9BACT|nr:hypothetical protein [Sulfurospirillum diekertiae]ARU49294.1 hypothetical protein Sdiek1_2135 [Sulfurospirillum diekertiae]ASC94104.1 hypothetical protein Sdiek2_2089 [Sulfurospirillum diekertiae]